MLQRFLSSIIAVMMQPFLRSDEDAEYAEAVLARNFRELRRLLGREPDGGRPILVLGGCTTPMHIACEIGDEAAVSRFIANQVDVNVQRGDGCSPVFIAAHNGRDGILALLIRAQADVDIQQWKGVSPLYTASQQGLDRVVELLLRAKADVDLQTKIGESPIYIAAQNNHDRIVRALIHAQARVNIQRDSGETPLYMASQNGHADVADLLIKAQAEANRQQKRGVAPLHIAAQQGHARIVSLLIDAGAAVDLQDIDGTSALHLASQFGHETVAKFLLNANASLNIQRTTGSSPLYLASTGGHERIVNLLIKEQADVNLRAMKGTAPLQAASQMGHFRIANALIRAQADVDIQNDTGSTSLLFAAQFGRTGIVESLIKSQANPNLLRSTGSSPLFMASQNGHLDTVKLLIMAQADFNVQNDMGLTPLHIASNNGHYRIVDLLVRVRADLNTLTKNGESALDIASRNRHSGIAKLLAEAEGPSRTCERPSVTSVEPKEGSRDSETHSVDDKLSKQLHKRLSQAGFVDSRASLQSALGDVLQQILQKRIGNLNIVFVVGSYSEGWGNNLVTLNGRTDIESDIDVMQLILGRLYHLRDWCQCREVKISDAVEYRNGHIFVQGFASNPAQTSHGTALRPSVDHVPACRLCCYPSIAPLLPDRASKSHIRSQVLDALRKELETSPCHAVHAASPTKRGEELRLSTTFLERRLLRSLTTLQGQLFVTLKYLVKKVICPRVNGMKAYHAKTVTFRMLEETAQSEWKPENFVKLLRRALKMLLNSVMKSSIQDKRETNKDGEVMEHFFLCDAAIYLKGANSRDAQEIANVLKDVLENLHQHLNDLMNYVQPTDASGRFAFHPFLILPILDHKPVSSKGSIEYHQIYDVVREGICQLCFSDCGAESQEALMKLIGRLPVCARSAREALRALAFLKFEQSDSALKVLTNCEWFRVSRGIDWPERSRITDATPEFVWKHLKSCDSAWKFCFEFKEIPTLKFLPKPLSSCCIINLEHVAYDCYYVNFEAVLQTLRLELSSNRVMADKWVEDVLNREDADGQEMLLCALSCTSSEQLSKVSGKLKSAAYLNAHADRLLLEKEVKLSRQETIRFVGKI